MDACRPDELIPNVSEVFEIAVGIREPGGLVGSDMMLPGATDES